MKILVDNKGYKYIDKDLFDYINNIWIHYDIIIDNDSKIYFAKNTTVNRLVTDYCNKGISRVVKPITADYVVIDKFNLDSMVQYMDLSTNYITSDDTKEPVFAIYNLSSENQSTIEMILEFIEREQEVKYVNQYKLNESLNNGYIIDINNYTSILQLVNSGSTDNITLAVSMLINSDLKKNWEWIMFLFYKKLNYITENDKKQVIKNYFHSLNLKYNLNELFNNPNIFLHVVKDEDILQIMENKFRQDVKDNIQKIVKDIIGTDKLIIDDFKLRYR